jgi:hypothetical protein
MEDTEEKKNDFQTLPALKNSSIPAKKEDQ